MKFMTNSEEFAEELSLRCNMKHEHQELTGQRAKEAAKYPEELCEAICRGLVKQIMCQEAKLKYLMAVRAEDEVEEESDEDGVRKNIHEGGTYGMDLGAWDDVSGASLDPKEVVKARLKEVGYVRDKRVWTKISRKEAIRRGIKIVGTRWIDINKGDTKHPNYRSRFVAKEFNDGKDASIFAATPPLEALRWLVSEAATGQGRKLDNDKVMKICDVARAFFEADAQRPLCIRRWHTLLVTQCMLP